MERYAEKKTRGNYELQEIEMPNLGEILSEFRKTHNLPMK